MAETTRPYGEMWRGTGLPAWGIALLLLAFLSAAVIFLWYWIGF